MAMATADIITANTAGTMSTSDGLSGRRAGGGLPPATARAGYVAALTLALALVVLALPRAGAQVAVLFLGDVREGLSSGRDLSEERLWHSRDAYDRALEFTPQDASLLFTRALISRRLAALADRQDIAADMHLRICDGKCLRMEALEYLSRTVAAAPSNGFAWALHADTALQLGRTPEDILPSLRLARLTMPNRASALLVQFRIAMLHWEAMPDEVRVHGLSRLTDLWSRPELRRSLTATYLASGFAARAAFREVLSQNQRQLEQFDWIMLSGEPLPRRLR